MVEAAYRLERSGSAFLEHLADTALTLRGAGFGAFAYTFDVAEGVLAIDDIASAGVPSEIEAQLVQSLRDSPPEGYLPFLLADQP